MNREPLPPSGGQHSETFFVDGHKVTVRYSSQENPVAVRAIKDVLISNIPSGKV